MGGLELRRFVRGHEPTVSRPTETPSRSYRPEIDGMRAVAVGAVIVYHVWGRALPGGFLGVDMFFVISGYVITLSLVRQPAPDFWSFITGFYSRRFRRLADVRAGHHPVGGAVC
jgi:peptidoglycan/LPS O-acetylase OafA/YrhL